MSRRLALLAGGGALVDEVVEAAIAAGDEVQLIALTPRDPIAGLTPIIASAADPAALLGLVASLKVSHLAMAGKVELPSETRGRIAQSFSGGSDVSDLALSSSAAAALARFGITLIGAHEIAPHLLPVAGEVLGPPADTELLAIAARGIAAARAIGALDLGQAIVLSRHRPIAAEDIAGTDALLARVAALRATGLITQGDGPLLLAKAMKPAQTSAIDLPAIGAATIEGAAAAGIAAIAVEAGRSLLIGRAEIARRASDLGVSVIGVGSDG